MADVRLQAKRDTVNIPLYSTEEAFQYPSMQAGGTELNRQVLVNMFPVVNKDPIRDDGGEVRLLQRPGLTTPITTNSDLMDHITLDYSECMAVLGMKGTAGEVIIAAYIDFDTPNIMVRIVQYRPGVSTLLMGSINLTSYGYTSPSDAVINLSEITHGTSATVIQPGFAVTLHPRAARSTSSNSDGWYGIATSGYFTTNCLTLLTAAEWPCNNPARGVTGPIVQLNNVHYVMTTEGFVHGSYPSDTGPNFMPDIATWNDLGETTASQDTDGGVSLVRYKHHLLAFGTGSMEFFNDEGLAKPNLPILRTQQAYARIGLANTKAFCTIDDELYFLGSSQDTGVVGLYKLAGYTPELISSVPATHILSNYGRYDAELYSFSTMGTTHILTNIGMNPLIDGTTMGADEPDNNEFTGTLVYCVTSKAWWIWAFEFIDYDSDLLTFGNSIAPQLRVAVTLRGTQVIRWVYVCAVNGSNEDFGVHPIQLWGAAEYQEGATYDKFRVNNSATTLTYRIPIAIRTNRLQFNSLNRKTIHKVKLQSMKVYDETNTFTTAEEWKLYLSAWKDTAADHRISASGPAADITRTIDIELPDYNPFLTMYNFGTCRSIQFLILSNNAYPMELGNLEATISLADH